MPSGRIGTIAECRWSVCRFSMLAARVRSLSSGKSAAGRKATPKTDSISRKRRMASNESPPRSKKRLCTLTSSMPRRRRQIRANARWVALSGGSAGRTTSAARIRSRPGRARASTFPFDVVGSWRTTDENRRHGGVNQPLARERPQLVVVDRLVGRAVGDQDRPAVGFLETANHAVAHPVVPHQLAADFVQVDAVTMHLDLIVVAAAEFDDPLGQPPCQIAGAGHPLAGPKRIGNEALGGQRGWPRYPRARPAPPM